MSQICPAIELVEGFEIINPTVVGSYVPVPAKTYHVITVFNETDQPAKVSYKDSNGNPSNFFVPANGRSFTRVMHAPLVNNTLHVMSVGLGATGKIFINLGN